MVPLAASAGSFMATTGTFVTAYGQLCLSADRARQRPPQLMLPNEEQEKSVTIILVAIIAALAVMLGVAPAAQAGPTIHVGPGTAYTRTRTSRCTARSARSAPTTRPAWLR